MKAVMRYKITVKTRTYRFATLDEAKRVADEIFVNTGVVVGIDIL